MTSYQGGKKRIGKKIHDAIYLVEEDLYGDHEVPYFEPFVGMAGVLRHFGADGGRRLLACDKNEDIILMWQAVQRGWKPPKTCTEAKYNRLKNSKTHSAERGFIGCAASWGGIFFHACRLKYTTSIDYIETGRRSVLKVREDLDKVRFVDSRSYDLHKPKDLVIYCDPPYVGNSLGNKKSSFQNFDHDNFWKVMRKWSKNNLVFISEWEAPDDFISIWTIKSYCKGNNSEKNIKKFREHLFVHRSIYKKINKKL